MKMERPGNVPSQEPSHEQRQNELRKLIQRQIEEYADGLTEGLRSKIEVETNPLDTSDDVIAKSPNKQNGVRFVFRYGGQREGFTDYEISDKTLQAAERSLDEFYRSVRGK